jgi:hypothetical protein
MHTITIDLPSAMYKRLAEQARQAGQSLEVLSRELLEVALQGREAAPARTAREILHAAGRIRPLSTALHSKIIPGVTLEEVRTILTQAAGPALSGPCQLIENRDQTPSPGGNVSVCEWRTYRGA